MSDFETELRTMLRERAADIATLPAHVTEIDAPEPTASWRHRRTGWLIAAAVIAVLAIAGGVWAARPGAGNHKTPPATNTPTVTHSTTPVRLPTGHAERKAALTWFGMAKVPGYTQRLLMSAPAYRLIEVLHADETSAPPGCNGCGQKSAQVYVFGKGKFDARAYGVLGLQQIEFAGHHAYLGEAHWYPGAAGQPKVATLAWQYRTDEWAMVQGLTPDASSRAELTRLAEAARPTVDVPITLPFKLDYVPDLPITEVYDNRPAGYSFSLNLGTSFSIMLWKGPASTYFDTRHATQRSIGGLPGYYSASEGAAVEYHGSSVAITIDDSDSAAAVVDERVLPHILDGLHWVPNGVPAQGAIP